MDKRNIWIRGIAVFTLVLLALAMMAPATQLSVQGVEPALEVDKKCQIGEDPASDDCTYVGPCDGCAAYGKPTSLTFQYTGGGCAVDNNQQGDKSSCSGSINDALPVTVTGNPGSISDSTVDPGEEFTVSDFDNNSVLTLSNAGGSEVLGFHASCSVPLAVGDVYGSLTLVAFNDDRGIEVTYSYTVTNNSGGDLTLNSLNDDQLGELLEVPKPVLADGETRTFEETVFIYGTTTNTVTASGASATDDDTVTVTVECCAECRGGVTDLTFQYLGTSEANFVVYDDSSADSAKILLAGTVQPNGEFSITKRSGETKLANTISLYVGGVLNTTFHTSCSVPIGPGVISGDFMIVESTSKDNGLICADEPCVSVAAANLVFDNDKVKWDITNTDTVKLEIMRITVQWPEGNGKLTEINLEGKKIHEGDFTGPPWSAVIESGWRGRKGDRTIDPGKTETLEFKFENNAALFDAYFIKVEFIEGCEVVIFHPTTPTAVSFASFSASQAGNTIGVAGMAILLVTGLICCVLIALLARGRIKSGRSASPAEDARPEREGRL